ncbi:protein of unknown function [Hyphomicrobium sp. 1Nfss2.1]
MTCSTVSCAVIMSSPTPTIPIASSERLPNKSLQRSVLAVGDISLYPSKQKLIVTGFAEAVTSARTGCERIFPDRPFHFLHSTDRGAPQLQPVP